MANSTPGSQIFATYQFANGSSFTFGASLGRGLWGQSDINGDGYNDLVINASFRQTPPVSTTDRGVVYVLYGSASGFSQVVDLADPAAWDGVQIFGEPGDRLGQLTSFASPVAAADLNNDGFDDVLIGAPQALTSETDATPFSRAVGIFGQASNDGSTVPETVNLAALSTDLGFEIEAFLNASAGTRFEPVGDIDGDGVIEVALTATRNAEDADIGVPLNGGYVYVFDTAPQNDGTSAIFDLFALNDVPDSDGVVFSAQEGERAGNDVTGLGDFNGDGIDDFAVASQLSVDRVEGEGTEATGAVTVVFGRDGTDPFADSEELFALTQTGKGLQIIGPDGDEILGKAIAGIGDVNNDGFSDLAAISFDPTFGERERAYVYIVYGSAEGGTLDLRWDPASIDDGEGGSRQVYTRLEGFGDIVAFAGPSDVKGLGDVNGDGIDDFAIGTSLLTSEEVGGPTKNVGAALLLFGQSDMGDSFDIQSLDGTNGYRIASVDPTGSDSLFGSSFAALGDIDNDNAADFAIGAPSQRQVQGETIPGAFGVVYVMHGGAALAQYDAADGATDGFIGFETVGSEQPVRFGFLPEFTNSYGEGEAGEITMTLFRSDPSGAASVNVSLSGTASLGTDYELSGSQTVEFADGETEAQLSVFLRQDSLAEPDETIVFGIESVTTDAVFKIDQTNPTGTITIRDDDTRVIYGFAPSPPVRLSEGDFGPYEFFLQRSDPTGAATVELSQSGTADALDYLLLPNMTLEFEDGQTEARWLIEILEDDLPEGEELINIGMETITTDRPFAVESERAAQTIIIEDNEDPVVYGFREGPSITLNEASISTLNVFIERSNGLGAATVELGLGGSATRNGEYIIVPGTTIEFEDGELATAVLLRPLPDDVPEETVDVILTINDVTTDFNFLVDEARDTQQILIEDDGDTLVYSLGEGFVTSERPGQTDITVPVFRSHGLKAASVDLDFGGTAKPWDGSGSRPADVEADYQVISTPVFAEGETEAQLTLRIFGDNRDEDNETIEISINGVNDQNNVPVRIGSPSSLQVVIADSNSPNTYSLGEDLFILEGDVTKEAFFVIERSLGVGTALAQVSIERTFGTGIGPIRVQFDLDNENLRFEDGETRIEVPFTVLGNLSFDGDDWFRVTLTGVETPVGTTLPTVLGDTELDIRLPDDDQQVYYHIEVPPDLSESDSSGFIEIVRDDPRGTAAVRLAVFDGTARHGEDYTFDLGAPSFDFRDGEDRIRVDFDLLDDGLVEADESFFVEIFDVTPGADAPGGQGGFEPAVFPDFEYEVAIQDDDTVRLSFSDPVMVLAEFERDRVIEVTVTRDNTAGELELLIPVGADTQSATFGQDYTVDGNSFVFRDGESEAKLRITVFEDELVETPNENIILNLLGARYTGSPEWTLFDDGGFSVQNDRAEIIINDFDNPVTYAIEPDFSVSELNKSANFTVKVMRDSDRGNVPFLVGFASETAENGVDFEYVAGPVQFLNGETEATLRFILLGDSIPEPDETFTVNLLGIELDGVLRDASDPSVQFGNTSTQVTFRDDDGAVSYQMGSNRFIDEGDGTGVVEITVTRDFTVGSAIAYLTFAGDAVPGDDYTITDRTASFGDGENASTILLTINGDSAVEGDEKIEVSIGRIETYNADFTQATSIPTQIIGDPQTVTLRNDDSVSVIIGDGDDNDIEATEANEQINLAEGDGSVSGTPAELDDDYISGFDTQKLLVFQGVAFQRTDMTVTSGSAILDVDSDGDSVVDSTVTLEGDFSDGDFMAVVDDSDTLVTFETFLPFLQESQAIDPGLVNGIINQYFLRGNGSSDFQVSLRDVGFAGYNNVVGVYEIDAEGNILDTRILFENANADKAAVAGITDVEAGNRLGFFIVQDAADWAASLVAGDMLSFVNGSGAAANLSDDSDIFIAVNGFAVDEMVFHSYSEAMNTDGVQHALSGVDVGGRSISVGFEDLTGGGDRDYQDVVFRIEVVDDFGFF